MNIVYNGIEILASSVEVFVLYKIYRDRKSVV